MRFECWRGNSLGGIGKVFKLLPGASLIVIFVSISRAGGVSTGPTNGLSITKSVSSVSAQVQYGAPPATAQSSSSGGGESWLTGLQHSGYGSQTFAGSNPQSINLSGNEVAATLNWSPTPTPTATPTPVVLPPGTENSGAIPVGSGKDRAPFNQWSRAPFSDSACGDPGTIANISIYPSSAANANRLLIYFQGGGLCYDYNTCFNMRVGSPAAGFYGLVSNLQGKPQTVPPSSFTLLHNNNSTSGNPFTGWSKVFVPYCTGDFGIGSHTTTYFDPSGGAHTINHVGFVNLKKFLGRLRDTFCRGSSCTMPAPVQIVIAGSSAGGYAAVWNYEQIRNAFGLPTSEIQVIDDAGPYMREPYWTPALQVKMAQAWWGTGNTSIPVTCLIAGNCDPRTGGQFSALLDDLSLALPGLKGSLLTAIADTTISKAFSKLTLSPPTNAPPFAEGPCGSAAAGNCLPDGYPGLQTSGNLHGYFCDEAIPDYVANEPGAFRIFEVSFEQTQSNGYSFGAGTHTLLDIPAINEIKAADGVLLSEFLFAQINAGRTPYSDHAVTDSRSACIGWSL